MSTTVKELIEDAISKAFITVNNIFQPKIIQLYNRSILGVMSLTGSATSSDGNTIDIQRTAAFTNAFNSYVENKYTYRDTDPLYELTPSQINARIYISTPLIISETYNTQIIEYSTYDETTDTLSVNISFITNLSTGDKTYRGIYIGSKVGNADATGTCSLYELASADQFLQIERITSTLNQSQNWGMMPGGTAINQWIRAPQGGIIPYDDDPNSTASYLGASNGWRWENIFSKKIDLTGNIIVRNRANGSAPYISYVGSNAEVAMIRFIDNTNDEYGNGIVIGGGGPTIIGGGESAVTILNDTTNWPTASGQETMVVANDGDINFLSNVQNGTSSAYRFIMGADGSFTTPVAGGLKGAIVPIASIGGSSTTHATALQNYFNSYKASTPRNKLIAFYDNTSGNGSLTFGYFLNGYDSSPYGGFFSAHYGNAYYIGISNGTYSQHEIALNQNGKSFYVGEGRNTSYGQTGVEISPGGYIMMSNPSSSGSKCGVYFGWNNGGSATAYIRETGSGYLNLHNNVTVNGAIVGGSTITASSYIYAAGAGNHDICAQNTTTGLDCRISSGSNYVHGLWSNGYIASGASAVTSSTTQGMWMVYRSQDNKVCLNNQGTGVYCGGSLTAGTTINAGTSITAGTTITAGGNIHAYAGSCHCYAESSITKCYVSCYSYGNSTSGSLSATHGIYSNGYGNSTATGIVSGTAMWLIYRVINDNKLYINSASTTTIANGQLWGKTYSNASRCIVGSFADAAQQVSGVYCSSATAFGVQGKWAGSSFSNKTINVSSSDIRLKENIEDCTIKALPIINKIRMRQFDWKDGNGHWDVGMIVDEMERDIDPKFRIGGIVGEDGITSYKSVDSFYLQGYEVKAIQELSAENDQLKNEITELKNILNFVNAQLEKLEKKKE